MTTLSDPKHGIGRMVALSVALGSAWTMGTTAASAQGAFQIEEATIGGIQRAIRQGETTCVQVVEAYLERARAYNGVCTQLVTADGGQVAPGRGAVRAGVPLEFPSTTVPVREILPDYDDYRGLPIELGRMEATRSDPGVQQQYGMVVGMTDAGQLNALSTLNLRGERSVTCKADCDAHPSDGALPAHCPAACEAFRRQPDALERAAELDALYGRNPDLDRLPMYCAAISFKDVFDTTDMRSTSGADTAYAMDAPPRDSTVVAELRAKGAIIYAKANLSEYNAGGGNPGGAVARSRTFGAGEILGNPRTRARYDETASVAATATRQASQPRPSPPPDPPGQPRQSTYANWAEAVSDWTSFMAFVVLIGLPVLDDHYGNAGVLIGMGLIALILLMSYFLDRDRSGGS